MSVHALPPLGPRTEPGYSDTAALNDILTILTTPDLHHALLAGIADVVTRTGRPMVAAREIEVHTAETSFGWPVACTHAGDTTVAVRQEPAGPGLLVEVTTQTDAEALGLTVTLDGRIVHPTGQPGPVAA